MTRKNKSTRRRGQSGQNMMSDHNDYYNNQNTLEQNPQYRQSNPGEHPRNKRTKAVIIKPRSDNQQSFVDALEHPEKDIIFGIGPAGTGKTMMATLFAIRCLQEGIIKKIVITRPTVSVEEDIGFLPGTLEQKLAPWLLPITDVFEMFYSPPEVGRMIEMGIIHIAPLGFMRGRTFADSIVLGDEMQNCSADQMKMLLTRIGEGSKLIITGDLNQYDRGFKDNGMRDFLERLEKRPCENIEVIRFDNVDIQRHPIIEHILDIYQ